MKLGQKFSKAFSSLGNKTSKLTTKIGDKTNSVIKQVQKKAGQIENTATNAFDKTKDLVNKIPDLNEKAIKLSQNLIKKSGGITDVLRKGASIGDKLINGVVKLGGGDIPLIGSALKVAGKATHQMSVGANKLDSSRDLAAKKLDRYKDVSRGTINDIEKVNQRKKDEVAQAQDAGADGFA